MYQVRKFVRRNRMLVMSVAAVLVVLVGGIVASTLFAIRTESARAETQLIADFLENDVLGSAGQARVGEATVSYILNAASQNLKGKLKDKPLIEASIRVKLGYTWRMIGDSDEAERHFLRAIDIYKEQYGEEHLITLNTMGYVGYIYEDQGRYRDMENLSAKILSIRQGVYGEESPGGTINVLAVALCHLGKYEEAESWFNKVLQSENARYEVGGEVFKMVPFYKCNLARVYTATGRYEKAEQLLCKNIEAASSDTAKMVAKYNVNLRYSTELAGVYREWGKYKKAETLLDKTLEALRQIKGDDHFLTTLCMYVLARLYVDQDRCDEAETLLGEALPIARRRMRPEHPVTLSLLNTYAMLQVKREQYDQAQNLFDEALTGRQRELGDDHPETLETINDLGILRREQGQYEDAESLLRQALEGREHKLGLDHPHTLESMHELAVLHIRQSEYDEAEPLLKEAAEGRIEKLGEPHPRTQDSIKTLIQLYEYLNKPEEANKWRAKLPE